MKHANSAVLTALALSLCAHAINLNVHCGQSGVPNSINAALKMLNPRGPNTLIVYGTCNENVVIQSFDRLTLTAQPGASIVDTTNGEAVVLDIIDSQRVIVSGFTIVGGIDGIVCESFSTCYFSDNAVRGSADAGVIVTQSNAKFTGDLVENNAAQGVISLNHSNVTLSRVTITGNGTVGDGLAAADARNHSLLQIVNSNIHDNADSGAEAIEQSELLFRGTTITHNGGDGVHVERSAMVKFGELGGSVVSGNSGSGVFLRDLSYGLFAIKGATLTGNGGSFDVTCAPQFPATRGAVSNIGGGTTNCVEP